MRVPALGEAATQLPWLSPCAASLLALARLPAASAWAEVRSDPAAVLLISSQCAADDYNAYAHRRIVIFIEIEKPQKLCRLHLGLQNSEIQFFGNAENPADIIDSTVRRFCHSIDCAFDRTRRCNESAVLGNKKTALSPQQVSL